MILGSSDSRDSGESAMTLSNERDPQVFKCEDSERVVSVGFILGFVGNHLGIIKLYS